MARVKVKVHHDCEKPDMVEKVIVHRLNGRFYSWLSGAPQFKEEVVYKADNAEWTCPCGSRWQFLVLFDGRWTCVYRTEKYEWRNI